MKKSMPIIVPILIMLMVATFCAGGYYLFYKGMLQKEERAEVVVEDNTFLASEYPKIMSVYPMGDLMDKYYAALTGQATQTECAEEDEIIKKVINNEIDIGVVPDLTDEQIKLIQESGVKLETIEIAKDALVFITKSSNPVNNITHNNLGKIYSGEITKWSEIGGTEEEIKAYQKPTNSFIQNMMNKMVMGEKELKKQIRENLIQDNQAIAELNSEYYGEEGRIGYTLYNYYDDMYNDVSNGVLNSDKMLSVNDVAPTEDNIANNTYPYTITYYMIFNSTQRPDGNVRNLISKIKADFGKNIAKEAGYIAK